MVGSFKVLQVGVVSGVKLIIRIGSQEYLSVPEDDLILPKLRAVFLNQLECRLSVIEILSRKKVSEPRILVQEEPVFHSDTVGVLSHFDCV